MLTTLYCDASWYHQERVGGWAVWLRSEKGRIVKAGVTPDYCATSFEAELASIFAGLHLAVVSWPETTAILVRNDCEQAITVLEGKSTPKEHGAKRLSRKICKLKTAVRIIPRWVKGHQSGDSVEAWINRKVDILARAEARAALVQVPKFSFVPEHAQSKQGPRNGT